jgi:hypothetical protein
MARRYGEVGTRAPGFDAAAGSDGVKLLGPGCTFCFVLGSAGMPSGLAPDSPLLAPSDAESPALGMGAVGCAAEGFELAAGSAGFCADGAG